MTRLRLVHPLPSLVNSVLVVALAVLAGGTTERVALLGLSMLGLQFSIGALNDVRDASVDALSKPWKPIPAGLVAPQFALVIAVSGGGGAVLLAALVGPSVALMAVIMLGCGVAYDLWLKPTRWAWACFSVAFATLPVFAWYGASGALPPRPEFLLPLAALAGPAIQLANGLVDLELDHAAGLRTLAVRLGRGRAWAVMAALVGVVHVLAWATLSLGAQRALNPAVLLASGLALGGLALSAGSPVRAREAGWVVQAVAVAVLGVGWSLAVR